MKDHRDTESTEDTEGRLAGLTHGVIGAAIEVHRHLGPGLLEGIYEAALTRELSLRGITAERQVQVPVEYKGACLGARLRVDLVVAGRLLVEIKAVPRLDPIHLAQVLTFLKLSRLRLGVLINFNVTTLRSGIRRIING